VAALAVLALQAGIALTGNYGFFNLLAAVLCLSLLDDDLLVRLAPGRARAALERMLYAARTLASERWLVGLRAKRRRRNAAAVAMLILVLSALTFVDELAGTASRAGLDGTAGRAAGAIARRFADSVDPWVLRWIAPFRSINGYGLFRRMTTTRPEIVIEGSVDGQTWREYAFRWKPGDPARRPRFVAPHMPRLDWQMWFAALRPEGAAGWLEPLLRHLLEGTPEVVGLIEEVPSFDGVEPRWIRLVGFRYELASPEERDRDGRWWRRTEVGPMTPPLSHESFSSGGTVPAPDGIGDRIVPAR
jgi:hypothetical protein